MGGAKSFYGKGESPKSSPPNPKASYLLHSDCFMKYQRVIGVMEPSGLVDQNQIDCSQPKLMLLANL